MEGRGGGGKGGGKHGGQPTLHDFWRADASPPNGRPGGRGGGRGGKAGDAPRPCVYLLDETRPEWTPMVRLLRQATVATAGDVEALYRDILDRMGMDRTADLQVLAYYLQHVAGDQFCAHVVPWLVQLVLQTPVHLRGATPLPVLSAGATGHVVVDEFQAVVLLAHCFLCLVPKRFHHTARRKAGVTRSALAGVHRGALKEANFLRLFSAGYTELKTKQQLEKLKCFGAYFTAAWEQYAAAGSPGAPSKLLVSRFAAQDVAPAAVFQQCGAALAPVEIDDAGAIESAAGCLQVDFANANLGGGVLGAGCVQEEIRFAICPGLLLARLLCETLQDHENVKVTGARQFARYTGYADTFEYAGLHQDETETSPLGFAKVCVTAADALNFGSESGRLRPFHQYEQPYMIREMFKAYASFKEHRQEAETGYVPKVVATGKWGCGAFRGDLQLKFVLQLIAASAAGCRRVRFYSYRDPSFAAHITRFMEALDAVQPHVTVARLYAAVLTARAHAPVFSQVLAALGAPTAGLEERAASDITQSTLSGSTHGTLEPSGSLEDGWF